MSDVTRILHHVQRGDAKAAEELLPLIYDELRKLAASKMAHESPGQTLQPTALVHEAWLRLVGGSSMDWNGRGHFFGAASEAMRRILIDRARTKEAQRRGGKKQERLAVNEVEIAAPAPSETMLEVNAALEKLEQSDPQAATVVKLRYFAGMTNEEAAGALNLDKEAARGIWDHARAWLQREITKSRS
jgi:RNA polymerase sigma factor (TIGR02999 family)